MAKIISPTLPLDNGRLLQRRYIKLTAWKPCVRFLR